MPKSNRFSLLVRFIVVVGVIHFARIRPPSIWVSISKSWKFLISFTFAAIPPTPLGVTILSMFLSSVLSVLVLPCLPSEVAQCQIMVAFYYRIRTCRKKPGTHKRKTPAIGKRTKDDPKANKPVTDVFVLCVVLTRTHHRIWDSD